MNMYKGFSTISKHKKFTLTDRELVVRNLTNMLNIREGELPGKPEYGTTIWNYLFEPNTVDVERRVTSEIERLINTDPRIVLEDVNYHSQHNGMVLSLDVIILPGVDTEQIRVLFDQDSGDAIVR
jgi:phage baseplate assembly protein W